ncbi:MAG: serine hydrolase domain-containing protein [Microthrixaceae bacterium]
MDVPIGGRVEPGFETIAEVFRANWEPSEGDPGELGASLNVCVDGRVTVELWGGWCDVERTRPWQRDTLVNAYSVGKALSATAVLSLVADGKVDLDTPIESYWPEFGAQGNSDVTMRTVLAHRAGLPCARRDVSVPEAYDFHTMAGILADTEPWWTPGTAHGYHVNTLGHLIGEPVCRVTGIDFGEVIARRVAGPFGAEIYLGLPEDQHTRMADVDFPDAGLDDRGESRGPEDSTRAGTARHSTAAREPGLDNAASQRDTPEDPTPGQMDAQSLKRMLAGAYFNPPELSGIGSVNTAEFRRAEIPSTNMACTAEGVARVFASLSGYPIADTPEILPSSLIDEATTTHSEGHDLVLGRDSRFGLGFMLHTSDRPIGIGEGSFGHFGHGGSLGFADRDAAVGFCFLTNRPGDRWQMPRTRRIVRALSDCLS